MNAIIKATIAIAQETARQAAQKSDSKVNAAIVSSTGIVRPVRTISAAWVMDTYNELNGTQLYLPDLDAGKA